MNEIWRSMRSKEISPEITIAEIAKCFLVCEQQVSAILANKYWKHIT